MNPKVGFGVWGEKNEQLARPTAAEEGRSLDFYCPLHLSLWLFSPNAKMEMSGFTFNEHQLLELFEKWKSSVPLAREITGAQLLIDLVLVLFMVYIVLKKPAKPRQDKLTERVRWWISCPMRLRISFLPLFAFRRKYKSSLMNGNQSHFPQRQTLCC